jgi:hypothetical protein
MSEGKSFTYVQHIGWIEPFAKPITRRRKLLGGTSYAGPTNTLITPLTSQMFSPAVVAPPPSGESIPTDTGFSSSASPIPDISPPQPVLGK